jgi:two-component system response regulator YesN
VKIFIERNFDKKVSLAQAASHAGLNSNYLSRAFEEHTGTGFSVFKTSIKIKKAREFLKQGFNVNQISDRLAYANSETFIRAFKKQTGFTPAMFRNMASVKPKKRAQKNGAKRRTHKAKTRPGARARV